MRQIHVLFVDDEKELGGIFEDSFASESVVVHSFVDPLQAIKACQDIHFDIGFLDFRMPQMTGDELAHTLSASFPIYLVTGESEPHPAYAFSGILPKPFDYNRIELIISEVA